MRRLVLVTLASALACTPLSVVAEVIASSEAGFVSHHEVTVGATPQQVWTELIRPAGWWNGDHSYSGNAANMTIAPVAGGCFCEYMPGTSRQPAGQVEHMRVIQAAPNSMLRMTGGLGPLQAEAVTAVLTMTIEPAGSGAKITWDYVVGGYMRSSMREMATVVDQVIGEQFTRLSGKFPAPLPN